MAGSKPMWESCLVERKDSPSHDLAVQALKVPNPQHFEVIAYLVSGSSEYILGLTRKSTAAPQAILEDEDAHRFLKKVGSHSVSPWASSTQGFQVLCKAEKKYVRFTLQNRTLSFVHGSSQKDVLSRDSMVTVEHLPDDDYVPCLLTCWGDTCVECKFRGLSPKPDSLGVALYKAGKFTDATIKCLDREMAVHRAVLAIASPVLDTMFSSGMQEAQEATLEIKDAAPATVQNMIEYIYTQTLSDTSDLAQLFELANKYMIPGLARDVGENMVRTLDEKNAREYCKVVQLHASLENAEAKGLWEQLYKKLQNDQPLMRVVFEELLADSCAGPATKRQKMG